MSEKLETLFVQLTTETGNLKKEQEKNLADYTAKFRKLDEEYNALLAKKNDVQTFLDESLLEEKKNLENLKEQTRKELVERSKYLQEAYTLNTGAKALKDSLDKELKAAIEAKEKGDKERKEKSEELAKRSEDVEASILSLKEKHEIVDDSRAFLGEYKMSLDKRDNDIMLREKGFEGTLADHAKLIERNEIILATNEETLKRITATKISNDDTLRGIQSENQRLIKSQEDIAFRERDIEKQKEDIKVREHDIEVGNAALEKKIADSRRS